MISSFQNAGATRSGVRRDAPKQREVISSLRCAIADGSMKPGTRLPIRADLESQFDTSRVTVQKALDQLSLDGFVTSRGSNGTFVADHPPCLNRYGLVFCDSPSHPAWGGYHHELLNAARDVETESDGACSFAVFYDMVRPESLSHQDLIGEIDAHRLAGVIFAEGPWEFRESPIATATSIPRLAVMSKKPTGWMHDFSRVGFDHNAFFALAIDILADHGCRRIAAILQSQSHDHYLPLLRAHLQRRDLEYRPAWCQGVPFADRVWGEHIAELLVTLPPADRPDGLLIADDNLVDAVCRGLVNAGVRPGEDLQIVAQSNFPAGRDHPLPMQRIGYNIPQLLNICLETLQARRLGIPLAQPDMLVPIREKDAVTAEPEPVLVT